MRKIPVTPHSFLASLFGFFLVSVPAHANSPQTNEYFGVNCRVMGTPTGYDVTIEPDGLTLTPSGSASHSVDLYCPANLSTLTGTPLWMKDFSFVMDARSVPSGTVATPACQGVLVTKNSALVINNVPVTDQTPYYGVESAYYKCTVTSTTNVATRIHGYSMLVTYYTAAAPL
ncbi:MAG TPA: hypothetical protein VFH68_19165 [Polyangia bacterium]|jgi:hypothetical protein|nr:hypothetical protein [Polyangia bacterium]